MALPPVWINLLERLKAGARTFAEAGGALAYFGDPARASAVEGEERYEILAEVVWSAVRDALATLPGPA